MFSGIVQAVGTVQELRAAGPDRRIVIDPGALVGAFAAGDSICVNGVCLTALAPAGGAFEADVSAATLSCTTLGELAAGDRVNLEPALRVGDRFGGHLVSGHVDGIGTIRAAEPRGTSVEIEVEAPTALAPYLCGKGSICIDGVSLTVNAVQGALFRVNLIPHTLAHTVAGAYRPGTRVNLEADLVARYLETLVRARG